MSVNPSVVAVIVTYNRHQKLRNVLDAIIAQDRPPEMIIVVDNASTDDTASVVEFAKVRSRITYAKLAKNIGGAGGFNTGIRIAFEEGYDFVWVMDDDGYPAANALSILVDSIAEFEKATEWRPSFACSLVKWTDGSICEMNIPVPVWDWPRHYTPELPVTLVERCSFVSALIPRWAIETHGLPIADYFIWYDDAEYTKRLSGSYPGLFCPESVIVHDTPENKGVNFSLVNDANVWKFEYGARNEVSSRLRDGGLASVAAFLLQIRLQMTEGRVPLSLKRRIWLAVWRGMRFRPAIERV